MVLVTAAVTHQPMQDDVGERAGMFGALLWGAYGSGGRDWGAGSSLKAYGWRLGVPPQDFEAEARYT